MVAATAEIGSRTAFRLTHGYGIEEHSAFLPHAALVFQNNPRYFPWRKRPERRFDFFFIPPLTAQDGPRLWVLGGSTSAAQPDDSDWPAALQAMLGPATRVVDMGHEGYGTSQIGWLYEHYREQVQPALVVYLEGWNYRGAMASRTAFQPWNTVAPGDGWPRAVSAFLFNHSAAYAMAYRAYHRRHRPAPCGSLQPYPQMAEWERELSDSLRNMSRRDRVFLVLFPGLAMRDDVRPQINRRQRCVADHFDFFRAEYEGRIAVLERVAGALSLPMLDTRQAYRRLEPPVFESYFRDQMHQTAEGNRFLAGAIMEELVRAAALPLPAARAARRAHDRFVR